MINTVNGPIPLDFSNTKIIRDGKVVDINDIEMHEIAMTAGAQIEKAESQHGDFQQEKPFFSKEGIATGQTARSYASDIGLFKAGMSTVDPEEVKKVIADSSANSEYYKT